MTSCGSIRPPLVGQGSPEGLLGCPYSPRCLEEVFSKVRAGGYHSHDEDHLAERRATFYTVLRGSESRYGWGQEPGTRGCAALRELRGRSSGRSGQPRGGREGGVRLPLRSLPVLAETARTRHRTRRLQREPYRFGGH